MAWPLTLFVGVSQLLLPKSTFMGFEMTLKAVFVLHGFILVFPYFPLSLSAWCQEGEQFLFQNQTVPKTSLARCGGGGGACRFRPALDFFVAFCTALAGLIYNTGISVQYFMVKLILLKPYNARNVTLTERQLKYRYMSVIGLLGQQSFAWSKRSGKSNEN